MLDPTNSDPDFMNTIITGDESWVYGYKIVFSRRSRWMWWWWWFDPRWGRIWDRRQLSILRNMDSYGSLAVLQI